MIDASSVGQSPPGRSTRPTEPWKRTSPLNRLRRLVGDGEGDVAGAVAGREEDVDLEARELELLAAGDRLVGVVALERAEARPGDVAMMSARTGTSISGQ